MSTSIEKKKLFSVVEFSNSAVAAVPTVWLTENNQCPWPDKPPKKFPSLVSNPDSSPDPSWKLYDVEVIKACESYRKADKKAKGYIKTNQVENTDQEELGNKRTHVAAQLQEVLAPEGNIHSGLGETVASTEGAFQSNIALTSVDQSVNGQHLNTEHHTIEENLTVFTLATQADINELREELRAFQKIVIESIEKQREEFKDVKKLLSRFLAQEENTSAPTVTQILHLLPVSTLEDYKHLKEKLEDSQSFHELSKFLSRVGGESVTKNVYNVLSTLFKPNLATEIGLTSNTGKEAIKDTLIGKVIREAVHNSPGLKGATDESINRDIGKWLRSKAYKPKHEKQSSNTVSNEEAADSEVRGESPTANTEQE